MSDNFIMFLVCKIVAFFDLMM